MKREVKNAFGKTFLTIEFDEGHGFVYNNWLGYQTKDSIVVGANACLEELARHGCHYLLNDNREVMGPWDHAVEWIAHDWTPRAIAGGLTHFAHVVGPESFAALSAEMMHTSVEDYFQMRIFGNIEAAQSWLRAAQELVVPM
jgi:hypothetical protein